VSTLVADDPCPVKSESVSKYTVLSRHGWTLVDWRVENTGP
jgi:hypothetical protein